MEAAYDTGDDECIICRLAEIRLPDTSELVGKPIVAAGLPEDVDIVLINRAKKEQGQALGLSCG